MRYQPSESTVAIILTNLFFCSFFLSHVLQSLWVCPQCQKKEGKEAVSHKRSPSEHANAPKGKGKKSARETVSRSTSSVGADKVRYFSNGVSESLC